MLDYHFSYEPVELSPAYWVVVCIIAVIGLVAMWRIFSKAGEPGWKCLIPLYNTYTEFKFVFGNGWLFLLMLIPFVNIVMLILLEVELCKSFGRGVGFTIGMILLPTIFMLILGFGGAEYIGSRADRAAKGAI